MKSKRLNVYGIRTSDVSTWNIGSSGHQQDKMWERKAIERKASIEATKEARLESPLPNTERNTDNRRR